MSYFLGIDVGTSSVKTLLADERGAICDIASREYDIDKPNSLFAQQDMRILWEKTCETIAQITGRDNTVAEKIAGIGFSGQMHGLVMLGEDSQLLDSAIIWADQRSSDQVRQIYDLIGEQAYKELTLNDLSSGFLLSSLLWVKQCRPQIYEKIRTVFLPKDYIRYRMCGEPGTDYSDASASLMFDVRKEKWAFSVADRLGLDRKMFPECHESHEVAGTVLPECAALTGLKAGTPVMFGGGDSIMQQLGNGVVSEDSPWIANIGTSCSLNCAADRPVYDRLFRVNTFCHAQKGMWFWIGASLCGGLSLKWLKNNLLKAGSYDSLNALAATVEPGSNGLVFLPYMNGSRCPVNDPNAQGMFFGLTLSHKQAHLVRSVMEGIVFSMKAPFQIFEEGGLKTDAVIASGGGARGSLFLQIEADMFNRPVYVALNNEQSCLGAAMTAAVGTGFYRDYKEAGKAMVRLSDEVVFPEPSAVKRYEESFEIYRELYETNKELFHRNMKLIR